MSNADYVDGKTARVHAVTVSLLDTGLLVEGAPHPVRWALPNLRAVQDAAEEGALQLSTTDDPVARLTIRDPALMAAVKARAPNLDQVDRNAGQVKKVVAWAMGALASVLLIVFVIVPALASQLAVLIPMERERQLGEAVVGQLTWALERLSGETGAFCGTADGLAALEAMEARLSSGFDTDYDLTVRVFDHPMANAFAVPGGHIVLFRGLLSQAQSPEEVAGVLAHEIGHVVHRDPTRLTLQSAGTVGILGLLVGDFSGGAAVLVMTERLVAASYTQDAEARADQFAFDVLAKAGLPSAPLAGLFDRFSEKTGDVPEVFSHFMSHPDLGSRADAAERANSVDVFDPVLTEDEWAALKGICAQPLETQ